MRRLLLSAAVAALLSGCPTLAPDLDPGYLPHGSSSRDVDGDGTPDDEDCDPADSQLNQDDLDDDGYSNCDGDCDDDDPTVHPGAEDVDHDGVDSDCDGFAEPAVAWVEEVDGSGWELHEDPPMAGFSLGAPLPMDDLHFQDLGAHPGAPGEPRALLGGLHTIVPETWDGDVDAYRVELPFGGYVYASLGWDETTGDLDASFWCFFENDANPETWYSIPFDPGLTDLSYPEEGHSIVPLREDDPCFFIIVGYNGPPTGYRLELTQLGL